MEVKGNPSLNDVDTGLKRVQSRKILIHFARPEIHVSNFQPTVLSPFLDFVRTSRDKIQKSWDSHVLVVAFQRSNYFSRERYVCFILYSVPNLASIRFGKSAELERQITFDRSCTR